MRAGPTTNGLGQTRQTIVVTTKYASTCSVCQPRPVRSCQSPGPNSAYTIAAIAAATLQNFMMSLTDGNCGDDMDYISNRNVDERPNSAERSVGNLTSGYSDIQRPPEIY